MVLDYFSLVKVKRFLIVGLLTILKVIIQRVFAAIFQNLQRQLFLLVLNPNFYFAELFVLASQFFLQQFNLLLQSVDIHDLLFLLSSE